MIASAFAAEPARWYTIRSGMVRQPMATIVENINTAIGNGPKGRRRRAHIAWELGTPSCRTPRKMISLQLSRVPWCGLDFNTAENALAGVVNKVHALFERKAGGRFDKWKPAAVVPGKNVD